MVSDAWRVGEGCRAVGRGEGRWRGRVGSCWAIRPRCSARHRLRAPGWWRPVLARSPRLRAATLPSSRFARIRWRNLPHHRIPLRASAVRPRCQWGCLRFQRDNAPARSRSRFRSSFHSRAVRWSRWRATAGGTTLIPYTSGAMTSSQTLYPSRAARRPPLHDGEDLQLSAAEQWVRRGVPADQRSSMTVPDIQFNGTRALAGARVVGEIHPPLMRNGTFLYINMLTRERGHARTRQEACEELRRSIIAAYERIARVKERPSSSPVEAAGGGPAEVDRRARLPYLANADDGPPLMMFGNRRPPRPPQPASVGQCWKEVPGRWKAAKPRKARRPKKAQTMRVLVRCRYCQALVRRDRLQRHVTRQHADRLPGT